MAVATLYIIMTRLHNEIARLAQLNGIDEQDLKLSFEGSASVALVKSPRGKEFFDSVILYLRGVNTSKLVVS